MYVLLLFVAVPADDSNPTHDTESADDTEPAASQNGAIIPVAAALTAIIVVVLCVVPFVAFWRKFRKTKVTASK